jgi:hypothetical protein
VSEVKSTDVETGWQCRECFLKPVWKDSQLEEAESHMIEEHGKHPEELHEIGIVKEEADNQ